MRHWQFCLVVVLLWSTPLWATQQTITLHADSMNYNEATGDMHAWGSVEMISPLYHIQADEIFLNQANHTALLRGNVVVRSKEVSELLEGAGEQVLEADEITLDTREFTGSASCSVLFFSERHTLTSRELRKTGPATYEVQDSVYSACRGDAISWAFRMRSATVTSEEYLQARGVTFSLSGVPLLYVPYMIYPVKNQRQSGFLVPSFSSGNTTGLGIHNTYYHTLDDQSDISVFANVHTRTGLLYGGEYRYRDSAHGDAFFSHRRISENNTTVDDPDRFRTYATYGVQTDHWKFNLQYDRVSDMDFVKDYLKDEQAIDGEFHLFDNHRYWSHIALTHETPRLATTILVDQKQQYRRLPGNRMGEVSVAREPEISLVLGRIGDQWQLGGNLRTGQVEKDQITRDYDLIAADSGVRSYDYFDRYRSRYVYTGSQERVRSMQYANLSAFVAKPVHSQYWAMEARIGIRADAIREMEQDGLPTAFFSLDEQKTNAPWYRQDEDGFAYLLPFAQARFNTVEPAATFGQLRHSIRLEADFDSVGESGRTGSDRDLLPFFSAQPLGYRLYDDTQTTVLFVPRLVNTLRYGRATMTHSLSQAFAPTNSVEKRSGDMVSDTSLGFGGFHTTWQVLYDPHEDEALRQRLRLGYTIADALTLSTDHQYTRYRNAARNEPGFDYNTLALTLTAIPRWTLSAEYEYTAQEEHFQDSIRKLDPARGSLSALYENDCFYWVIRYSEDYTRGDEVDSSIYFGFGLRT